MRYFVFISDQKSCCAFHVCAFHTSKLHFILQPQEQKSCKRQTQCYNTLCGCLCTWPIWCCPVRNPFICPQPFYLRYLVCSLFLVKNRMWSKIHSFHYLNIPPGKYEHRIKSLSSLGHITCEWEASSFQPTIILDVIAVYPCFHKKNPIKDQPYLK